MSTLSKRQAKRLVLAYNAQYLTAGAESDSITAHLSEREQQVFQSAQDEFVAELMRRSGLDEFRDGADLLQWAKQR